MVPFPPKIYLASRSPRRRELLKQIGVAFEVLLLRTQPARGPDVDESVLPGEAPRDYVTRVCRLKADVGWERILQRQLRRQPVLAADTTVCLENEILGKPADRADAARMLALLSGREHRVLTAVALKLDSRSEMVVNETAVRFGAISESDIQAYIESGEPMDKAGAYAIQGRAAAFVTELRGSYSGVMGLPLYETARLIEVFRSGTR
ncbi:MAG TPA: Maf family protein [Steroidobacteraceae bacterium]|nr:Maf family protein [Steroidobacteraceae bacterium]